MPPGLCLDGETSQGAGAGAGGFDICLRTWARLVHAAWGAMHCDTGCDALRYGGAALCRVL